MENFSIKRAIPNLFTFGSMALGFVSVIRSSEGDFYTSAVLIFIAAIFDGLDGLSARLTHTSNKFGVELDSLADVVSFGLAPAYLLYSVDLNRLGNTGIFISLLPLLAGGYRLARFNATLQGFDKKAFSGLPIPSAAMTLAAFVLTFTPDGIVSNMNRSAMITLIIFISLLMVSKIKYPKLPGFNKRGIKDEPVFFVLLVVSLILLLIMGFKVLFYLFF